MNTKMQRKCAAVVILLFLVCASVSIAGQIIYVDDDAPVGGDGASWQDACKYLQDALSLATDGNEIYIAQGLYKPDVSASIGPTGNHKATFAMKSGVVVMGGFAGVNAHDPSERNVTLYETILSGDLLGNDVWPEDLFDVKGDPTLTDNSYTVVTWNGVDDSSALDGLTITGGHNTLSNLGGGIYATDGVLTVRNCTFIKNWAGELDSGYGGGAIDCSNCNINIIDSLFRSNACAGYGGACFVSEGNCFFQNCMFVDNKSCYTGGAIYCAEGKVRISQCLFKENLVKSQFWQLLPHGGALRVFREELFIVNSQFIQNNASYNGGAIDISESVGSINQCLFETNTAKGGGALYLTANNVELKNCTFSGNHADTGSILEISVYSSGLFKLNFENCIFWGSEDWLANDGNAPINISYSDIQGGWPGEGNVDADPCFVSPGYWDVNGTPEDMNDDVWVEGDYHLKSQAGRWDSASSTWVIDDATSPCIDAGNPTTPIGSEPFPNGGLVNMGCYGGTEQASKSYFESEPCQTILTGDINGDCVVDWADFMLLGMNWLKDSTTIPEIMTQASDPLPLDGSHGIYGEIGLIWKSGELAESHDVYFGPNNPPPYRGNQSYCSYFTGVMKYSTVYYWRIDEVGPDGKVEGQVWSFKTEPIPEDARNPYPADGTWVDYSNVTLSWTPGHSATSHDVYFGYTNPPAFICNQTKTSFRTDELSQSGWYYWKVDEISPEGKTEGQVWKFEYRPRSSTGGSGGGSSGEGTSR